MSGMLTDCGAVPASGEIDEAAGGDASALRAEIFEALRTVRDPEIPVNLVDLGLIYGFSLRADGVVQIDMTLTTPSCPVAGSLPGQVQHVVSLVPGVSAAIVQLVWEPAWTPERMSLEAKLELGLL